MKTTTVNKLLILVLLILFILLIYKIVETYAVFYYEANANIAENVADWVIYVNDINVTTVQEENFVIDNLNFQTNEHVKPGNLAPTMIGSFDFTIEPKNTQVAIRYDITLDIATLQDSIARFISVEEINIGNDLIETAPNVYTGIISLEEIQNRKVNTIQTTIEWDDDGENDEKDTSLGTVQNPKIQLPISIKFTQYMGEEIVQFEPEEEII